MTKTRSQHQLNLANRRLVNWLAVTVVAMFAFGYALVPLYEVFCEVTGFSGRTGVVDEVDTGIVDQSRWVTVQFVGITNSSLDWDFGPNQKTMLVRPGALYETSFSARNRSSTTTIGSARPSVSPIEASRYFNKTECFCFTSQAFSSGESRDMPVRFVVDANLPSDVNMLTLSYTFFNVTDSVSEPEPST